MEALKPAFGLIGCGHIGYRHASLIQEKARLSAVCDVVPEKAAEFARQFHCPAFHTINDLFTSGIHLDAVAICTPNFLHAQQSVLALSQGCHVLCEKPMAISAADAEGMMQAAVMSNRHLVIVKQNRFNPPVEWVRSCLDSGLLGKVLSVHFNGFWNRPDAYYENTWKGTLEEDGGTLYTQFSHFVDLLIWFFGPLDPAFASFQNRAHPHSIDFEDTGSILAFTGEHVPVSINYSVNSFRQNLEGSITILGDKGSIKIGGQYLNVLEHSLVDGVEKPVLGPGNPANDYGFYTGSMSNHPSVYDQFLNAIQGNFALNQPLLDAVETVRFIEKAYTWRNDPLLSQE